MAELRNRRTKRLYLSFDESSHHFLSSITCFYQISELLLLKNYLPVSPQQNHNYYFAFKHGQMLPYAVSGAWAEGEKRKYVFLFGFQSVPSVRVEHLRMLSKRFLVMVGHDRDLDDHSFFDWQLAQIMVFGGLTIYNTSGRSIHP